eukprot:CAMPEP_0181444038 /NCGR_PEP_ID=MMETSP1110-20121109/24860_1 /TAXON_ID=174948 /ORGANISM="Symbiodinium sp., Strain CCMP421" /LENGTH=74 /DNA_ID=CAMNT_0023568027 /DNA_START=572 /DNA_END=793 /DNA_ORIENTATION=-
MAQRGRSTARARRRAGDEAIATKSWEPSVAVGKRRGWGAPSPFPIFAPSSEAAPLVEELPSMSSFFATATRILW